MLLPGMKLSLREWTGLPYRSPQRIIRETILLRVTPVKIDTTCMAVTLAGILLTGRETEMFAHLDGFKDAEEMSSWFEANHGDAIFEGIVMYWPNALHELPPPCGSECNQDATGG